MSPNSFTKEFGEAIIRGQRQKKFQLGYHAFRKHIQSGNSEITSQEIMKQWLGMPEHQKLKWVPEEVRD